QGGDQVPPPRRAQPADSEVQHPLPVQGGGAASPGAPQGGGGGARPGRSTAGRRRRGSRRRRRLRRRRDDRLRRRVPPSAPRVLAITLGDPAGIGPEIVLRALAAGPPAGNAATLLIGER